MTTEAAHAPTRRRRIMSGAGLALVGVLLVVARSAAAQAQQSLPSHPSSPTGVATLVIDDVTVVDVEQGTLLPEQRVVIKGNRIRALGTAATVPLPGGAQVVDGAGKYLIPGLWDLHTHAMDRTAAFYPLFIANGITGIRDASSTVPLDSLHRWRREILAGTRVGPPRQLLVGLAFQDAAKCQGEKNLACVATVADVRRLVDSLKAAGANMLKAHILSAPLYFALAAEARRVRLPFGGHVEGGNLSAVQASDSGARILDHASEAGGIDTLCLDSTATVEQCQRLTARFRRNDTWFVPTLQMVPTSTAAAARVRAHAYKLVDTFMAGAAVQTTGWLLDSNSAARPSTGTTSTGPVADSAPQRPHGLMRLPHRVGLPILAGTDVAPLTMNLMTPGFVLHAELAYYVAEGLTPLEALQTATLNPAKMLHATDSLGTVAPGKLADLVLLDANPLADIANTTTIRGVVSNGRYFDRAALDHLIIVAQADIRAHPPSTFPIRP